MAPKNNNKGGGKSAPAPSRNAAKTTARTAASTGTATKENFQAMRQAGVNPAKIQSIRGENKAIKGRNTASQTASANTNANIASAIDNRFNSGQTIGREFYNSPEFQNILTQNPNADGKTLSEADVAKYSMAKGYGLDDQYMKEFGTGTAPRQPKNIRQALKIAAANDPFNMIDRKEGRQIYQDYADKKNLDAMKFTGILDKMNANFDKKGKQQIGLAGGSLNLLSSGKLGNTGIPLGYGQSYMRQGQEVPLFGSEPQYGGLSGVLRNMGQTGKFNRGDTIYGQYSTGQFRDSPGMGKTWADTKWAKPADVAYKPWATPSDANGTTDTTQPPDEELPPDEPQLPEEPKTPTTLGSNQFGAGLDFASFAPGWRSKKGQRAKAGTNAQGYGSMRTSPWSSFGTGINFGYS